METQNAVVVAQPKKATVSDKLGKAFLTAGTAYGMAVSSIANAAPVDVSPLKAEIEGNGASIQTIGLAILGLVALIVGIMYIRRVMR